MKEEREEGEGKEGAAPLIVQKRRSEESSGSTKKVVCRYFLHLQLPESGQAWSIRLCTTGWVRLGGAHVASPRSATSSSGGKAAHGELEWVRVHPVQGEGPCVPRTGSSAHHLCDLRQVTYFPLLCNGANAPGGIM